MDNRRSDPHVSQRHDFIRHIGAVSAVEVSRVGAVRPRVAARLLALTAFSYAAVGPVAVAEDRCCDENEAADDEAQENPTPTLSPVHEGTVPRVRTVNCERPVEGLSIA